MGACSESIGMVFNRSGNAGFFLTLEDNDSPGAGVVLNPGEPAATEADPIATAAETPAVVAQKAVVAPKAVVTPAALTDVSAELPAAEAVATTAAAQTTAVQTTAVQTTAVQTTAEAIAAELAAAEAARPAVPLTTFAPDNLMPGTALRQSRRRPGASMKSFRTIAGDLFKA